MPYRVMEESLNAVIDSLSDGILVTDDCGCIMLYNQKAEEFLGLKGYEALGQPFQDHVKNQVVVKLITKIMLRDPYQAEEICLMDTGDSRVRVHVNPVRDAHEALLGSVTLLHDVARLSAIEKIKNNFLSMVSHQLKSPLSSTLLQTSILLDGMVGELNDKQKDLTQKIKAKIRGMTDLVNDVLDVCFIEEGAHVTQIESLNLPEILERAVELMLPQAQDKHVCLQVKIREDLPLLTGNRSSIEAMFLNLISNAIKYTPTNGRVRVNIAGKQKNVTIEVSDNGIGVEAKDIPHIFEKFFRERTERTKDISGTGLGLSIVKGVVEAHQGSVNVESEVGKGSTFTVMLPIIRKS